MGINLRSRCVQETYLSRTYCNVSCNTAIPKPNITLVIGTPNNYRSESLERYRLKFQKKGIQNRDQRPSSRRRSLSENFSPALESWKHNKVENLN